MTALPLAATTASRPPRIIDEYLDRTPCSRELFARSATLFPSGITHDSRQLDPYPIYVERAFGPLKWDVDGHEYVDYIGGHGALILGHNDPDVTMAATAQLAKGTHYGASHQLEVEWGEEIRRLVPSAERIRFTNSGMEATLLGLRLARAATGKPRVLRFAGHFHGWHDHATIGHMMPALSSCRRGIWNAPDMYWRLMTTSPPS